MAFKRKSLARSVKEPYYCEYSSSTMMPYSVLLRWIKSLRRYRLMNFSWSLLVNRWLTATKETLGRRSGTLQSWYSSFPVTTRHSSSSLFHQQESISQTTILYEEVLLGTRTKLPMAARCWFSADRMVILLFRTYTVRLFTSWAPMQHRTPHRFTLLSIQEGFDQLTEGQLFAFSSLTCLVFHVHLPNRTACDDPIVISSSKCLHCDTSIWQS